MLTEYMRHVASHQANVELVLLLCKANLKPFYSSCGTLLPPPKLVPRTTHPTTLTHCAPAAGFEEVGESDVVHGQEKWYEMKQVPRRK
jgi:hypothetical protein